MVDQALIQTKVSFGLGKAATVVGAPCVWYRPQGATSPITASNEIGIINAYFRPPAGSFVNSPQYGKPTFHGSFDPTDVLIGDYLVEPVQGTFFVAQLAPVAYPLCVGCNRTLNITRPGAAAPGSNYYGGDVTASETPLMTGWPGSMLTKSRGSEGETKLPGDIRLGYSEILVPSVPGVILDMGDCVVDDTGARFTISSAELTTAGWRLMAGLAAP